MRVWAGVRLEANDRRGVFRFVFVGVWRWHVYDLEEGGICQR